MFRVYVAGRYSGSDVIEILSNMRKGIELSVEVMRAGFCPYIPWLDFQIGLHVDFDVETYKRIGLEWVKVCHAVILVPNQEISSGVRAEIDMARNLGIPVFTTITDLLIWREMATQGV